MQAHCYVKAKRQISPHFYSFFWGKKDGYCSTTAHYRLYLMIVQDFLCNHRTLLLLCLSLVTPLCPMLVVQPVPDLRTLKLHETVTKIQHRKYLSPDREIVSHSIFKSYKSAFAINKCHQNIRKNFNFNKNLICSPPGLHKHSKIFNYTLPNTFPRYSYKTGS